MKRIVVIGIVVCVSFLLGCLKEEPSLSTELNMTQISTETTWIKVDSWNWETCFPNGYIGSIKYQKGGWCVHWHWYLYSPDGAIIANNREPNDAPMLQAAYACEQAYHKVMEEE